MPHHTVGSGTASHRVYYERHGDEGAPNKLVFAMGVGGTLDMWEAQTAPLREKPAEYQYVAVDNRGVGRSDYVRGVWSTAAFARDVLSVLAELGWTEGVHAVGLSMGGAIVQEMLRQARPRQFASATFISTVSGGLPAIGVFALSMASGLRLLAQTMVATSDETRMQAALGILFEDDWRKQTRVDPATGKPVTNADAFVAELKRRVELSGELPPHMAWTMFKQTMAVSLHNVPDKELSRVAASVNGNVVVITGDKDILVHPWHSYRLARKLGVKPVILRGARHGANEQFADEVNALIARNVAAGNAAFARQAQPGARGAASGALVPAAKRDVSLSGMPSAAL